MVLQVETPDCSHIESFMQEALLWEIGQLTLFVCAGCGILFAQTILQRLSGAIGDVPTSSKVLDCIHVVVKKDWQR